MDLLLVFKLWLNPGASMISFLLPKAEAEGNKNDIMWVAGI